MRQLMWWNRVPHGYGSVHETNEFCKTNEFCFSLWLFSLCTIKKTKWMRHGYPNTIFFKSKLSSFLSVFYVGSITNLNLKELILFEFYTNFFLYIWVTKVIFGTIIKNSFKGENFFSNLKSHI